MFCEWTKVRPMNWLIVISLLLCSIQLIHSEVLNPPYFNIAEGRNISATETCGDKVGREIYCKIVGSMWTDNIDYNQNQVVQGQACDYCDPNDPRKAHPAEYAIDGSSKWWQSPPLSRGPGAARVNLTIDLGQEFHVAYVYIAMANSPRPGVWVLERSNDKGVTFKPWMYFADSREECTKQFGEESVQPLTRDDQVICETKYSKLIPLENGEMVVSLIEKRPSGDNFTTSKALQEFTKATNVRLRFIKPQTTFGHLLNTDQTVTRRYFYSIKDINIGGRCVCNGHAETCDVTKQDEPNKLYCACQHNTDGDQCQSCKPGYSQRHWQAATPLNPFECEPCNCNGHSNKCVYDANIEKEGLSMDIYGKYSGGGVCQNCTHPTTGINCHECKFGYYRPTGVPANATKPCVKCNCPKLTTSHSGGCDPGTGTCQCKSNFVNAPACDKCAYGYHKEPECPRCPCYRSLINLVT